MCKQEVHTWQDAATQVARTTRPKGSVLTDQCTSLHIGVSPMIGGDGLLSFNFKLAVLVGEPDAQIKKVRHAHLILVNLPVHISPACQLLCDSNHHRHMPLLCAPPSSSSPRSAVVLFLPGLTFMCLRVAIVQSETVSSFKKKKKKNHKSSAGRGGDT